MKYLWRDARSILNTQRRIVRELVAVLLLFNAGGLIVAAQTPHWTGTGKLNVARFGHTATLLANGKVLVAGGNRECRVALFPPCVRLDSAELYDPDTGTWSLTGNMKTIRIGHAAVRLSNGRVLVAGGSTSFSNEELSAELYDPATGVWTATGDLKVARTRASAVLLANGKVLLSGGSRTINGLTTSLNSAELYDPVSGTWSLTGALSAPRLQHSATLLPNGMVLAAGGSQDQNNSATLGSAELYDPASGTWRLTGSLLQARTGHTATLLQNGKVLVVEGYFGNMRTLTAELYDPLSGTWSATSSPSKSCETATLLPNSKVLITCPDNTNSSIATEIYDPERGTWTADATLTSYRLAATATLLTNGKVLLTGGETLVIINRQLQVDEIGSDSAELYDAPRLPGPLAIVSAASYRAEVAGDTIVAAFGTTLASSTVVAQTLPLPTFLAGLTVKVKDNTGRERDAPLFFVSPGQLNFLVPSETPRGAATFNVMNNGLVLASGTVQVATVTPGLFSANASGQGVAAAVALRVRADGTQTFEPVARFDATQNRFVAAPLDLGPEGEQVFLLLFGTGLRQRSALAQVTATLGGVSSTVEYAGPQGELAGLDQVNLRVPRALAGRGEVNLILVADGQAANVVNIGFR